MTERIVDPTVHPCKPSGRRSGRVAFHAVIVECGRQQQLKSPRIEYPLGSASVLDTDGPIRHDRVEARPIERTGPTLVVLDAAEPSSWGCQTIPFGKRTDQMLAF